jgi:hypothetical protein
MKTLAVCFTIFTLFSLSAIAQHVNPPEPTIVFDKVEHNYGEIEYGGDGMCTFTFTNKGEEPIMLTSVNASCGCTAPNWSREPIKPGDTGEVKVKYNTNIVGAFNKSVTVSSTGQPAQIVLRIKGNVKPKVVVPQEETN